MYYFKYNKIYNKINDLNTIIKVNYNISKLHKAVLNKPIKQPLIQHILTIAISSNNGGQITLKNRGQFKQIQVKKDYKKTLIHKGCSPRIQRLNDHRRGNFKKFM